MATGARNLLLYGPLLALWALLFWVASRHLKEPVLHAPAARSIPPGPLALASADARALRGTRLGALLRSRGERWLGVDLGAVCGGDPLARADEVAVAVPASPRDGEAALVVAGDLVASEVMSCASRVIEARGGRPVALREGSFVVVTDVRRSDDVLTAARQGGPLLLGASAYVRRMMAATEGREPSVEADARHAALRAEVAGAPLVLSVLLSADLRDRLRAEVADPATSLSGVLGFALGLGAADPAPLRVVVGCDGASACVEASALLRRRALAAEPAGPLARGEAALPWPAVEALLAALAP